MSQVRQLDRQNGIFNSKNSKVMTQTKLTSLYSGKALNANNNSYKKPLNTKSNSSAECISENNQPYEQYNHQKRDGFSKYLLVDEDEKNHPNSLGTKRMHLDVSSHKDVIELPPSQNEGIDVSNNSFVTARAKMVLTQSLYYCNILLSNDTIFIAEFFFFFIDKDMERMLNG